MNRLIEKFTTNRKILIFSGLGLLALVLIGVSTILLGKSLTSGTGKALEETNFATKPNPLITKDDKDGDGISNAIDKFPDDHDNDGVSDSKDTDNDNDGVPDSQDSSPNDYDNDGVNDEQDSDDDNDGVPDSQDSTPQGEGSSGSDDGSSGSSGSSDGGT